MHAADLAWAFTPANANPMYGYEQPAPEDVPDIQEAWGTDGEFEIGHFRFQTLHVPGHSPGSVAFYFEDDKILIGGDVLFRGGMGRDDLPGGNTRELFQSLVTFSQLPPDTVVYPGHGPETTIEQENATNPYLQQARKLAGI